MEIKHQKREMKSFNIINGMLQYTVITLVFQIFSISIIRIISMIKMIF